MLWLALWVAALSTAPSSLPDVSPEVPPALPPAIAPPGQLGFATGAPTPRGPQGQWYGAPIAIVDALDVAAFAGVLEYDNHPKPWAGTGPAFGALLAVYLFDGVVVHSGHNQPNRAGESVLLRAGAFLAGTIVGVAMISNESSCGGDSSPNPDCSDLAYAIIIPSLMAMAIDDWFFARDPVVVPEARSAAFAPRLVVKPGLAFLGLGGAF